MRSEGIWAQCPALARSGSWVSRTSSQLYANYFETYQQNRTMWIAASQLKVGKDSKSCPQGTSFPPGVFCIGSFRHSQGPWAQLPHPCVIKQQRQWGIKQVKESVPHKTGSRSHSHYPVWEPSSETWKHQRSQWGGQNKSFPPSLGRHHPTSSGLNRRDTSHKWFQWLHHTQKVG